MCLDAHCLPPQFVGMASIDVTVSPQRRWNRTRGRANGSDGGYPGAADPRYAASAAAAL